ncbi:MAG TPA: hypothetical protein VE442_17145 [Jatrophihabitans sp.]|nr:hypothetical protein [Jatrophihabitans sp.]
MLVAVNLQGRQRDPNYRPITAFSPADRERVHTRWVQLTAGHEREAQARLLQQALREHQQQLREARAAQHDAPGTTAATTAGTAVTRHGAEDTTTATAVGVAAGAQLADARHAAEHSVNVETDSAATNRTPHGLPAISTDRIDMDQLTARLYERLRSRLRTELLIDRERAGLLTDFR